MRKGIIWLIFLIIIFSCGVFAEESRLSEGTEAQETIAKEIQIMHQSNLGAQIRFLQLERAILLRIEKANLIVNFLKEKNVDTSSLEGIVIELQTLADEAKEWSARAENETNKSLMIQSYYEIRHDSYILVKEFRKKVSSNFFLSAEEKAVLAQQFKEIKEQKKEITNKIQEKKRFFIAEYVKKIYEASGKNGDFIASKIANGELNSELINELKSEYMKLKESEREQIRNRIREEIRERNEISTKTAFEIKQNAMTRASVRLEERAKILEEKSKDRAAEILAKNSEILKKRAEELEKKSEEIRTQTRKSSAGAI